MIDYVSGPLKLAAAPGTKCILIDEISAPTRRIEALESEMCLP